MTGGPQLMTHFCPEGGSEVHTCTKALEEVRQAAMPSRQTTSLYSTKHVNMQDYSQWLISIFSPWGQVDVKYNNI